MPVDYTKSHRQWNRYMYMRDSGHTEFVRKADKCDNFFVGEQWLPEDLQALGIQKRPALTINQLLVRIATVLGEQIQNRNDTIFLPRGDSSADTATVLTKLYKQISDSNQLDWIRSSVFEDGVIRSRGYFDARLDFSDNLQGEVRISQVNSKNVLVDPDAYEYDPERWMDVVVSTWMTPDMIGVLYNEDDAEILRQRATSVYPYGYDSIDQFRDRFAGSTLPWYYASAGYEENKQMRRYIRVLDRQWRDSVVQKFFVDAQTGDMRPVPDAWSRDKIAFAVEKFGLQVLPFVRQRIRWTVTADDVVLHDDWSPYKYFTIIPYFPYFRHGRTVGLVENLIGPQELLNKVKSQELHVVNTTANSGWKVKTGALTNMTTGELEQRGAETGLVVELNDISQLEKIQPNQIPSGLDRISSQAEGYMERMSVSDSMLGLDREDVAAKAIQQKRTSSARTLSKVMDNLSRTDWILARNVLSMVQDYYTEPRIINVVKNGITGETERVELNQMSPEGTIVNDLTIGEYDIITAFSPERDSFEDSQFEQGVKLKELGVPIPDDMLIRNSRLAEKAKLIQSLEAAKQDPEAQRLKELQARAMEAEVAKTESKAHSDAAEAKLRTARAVKEMQTVAAGGEGSKVEIDPVEKYRIDQEMAMKKYEIDESTRLKEQELQIRRDELRQKRAENLMASVTTPAKSKTTKGAKNAH